MTHTSLPALRVATIRSATRLIRSALATEEPPYFCTTSATGANPPLHAGAAGSFSALLRVRAVQGGRRHWYDALRVPALPSPLESRSHDLAGWYSRMADVRGAWVYKIAAVTGCLAALAGCATQPPVLPDQTPSDPAVTGPVDPW